MNKKIALSKVGFAHNKEIENRFQINNDQSQNHQSLINNELNLLAHRLLMNPVIHHFTLGKITPLFPEDATARHETEIIPIRYLNEQQLSALSQDRRSALSLS